MKSRVILRLALLFACVFAVMASHCQSISGIINNYYKVTAINTFTSSVTVSSAAGLSPGMKVLMIEMKGASINTTNTSSFGNISALNNAGNYEMNFVCGISGNTVSFKYQILRSYDAAGAVQLVTVPQYNSVTIVDTVKASPWNSSNGTGGIIVMEASGTVFLNAPIDASGSGFEGGSINNYSGCVWSTNVVDYSFPISPADANTNGAKKGEGIANFILNNEYGRGKQANGGGGGNNHNTGGGGGSNWGTGGQGGNRSNETFFLCHGTNPGVGGLSLSTSGYTVANNRIYMGGGGGAGHENNSVATPGGNGGGIIIIKANTINSSSGKILANGAGGRNPLCSNPLIAEGDGGGGGGAGGSIVLDVVNYTGLVAAEVKGADGSISGNATNNCTGPGGGGGGGVVWCSGTGFPSAVNATYTGGASGFIALINSGGCGGQVNGATAGTAGATASNFVIPALSSFVCSPLAVSKLLYFSSNSSNKVELYWKVADTTLVKEYSLQKSFNNSDFETIATLNNQQTKFDDRLSDEEFVFYRLNVIDKNGNQSSAILHIEKSSDLRTDQVKVFPNPVFQNAQISIRSDKYSDLLITLFDQHGTKLRYKKVTVPKGSSTHQINCAGLPSALYYLKIEMNEKTICKKIFIHQSTP